MSRLYTNNFMNFNKYVIDIIEKLISNEEVCKLIVNKNQLPLSTQLPKDFVKEDLVWKNVFPYMFIPDAVEQEDCFIMIDFDDFSLGRRNPAVTQGYVLIDILCHENLMRTLGGTRTNDIMGRINTLLNGQMIGANKLMFKNMKQWHRQPRQYIGYTLAFTLTDVNEW